MYECLTLTVEARGIARVALSRPDKHNAMSGAMIAELAEVAHRLGQDTAIRVVVLTGEGKSFCAGADLGWMMAQIGADAATRRVEATRLARMLGLWNDLSKPVIGRLQGNALGGGIGLACVCDVAIAAEGARFGLTETRLGLIPATIGPYVIARMGEAMARRVFMSARLFDADEAVRLGLVARVVPLPDLDAAVEAEILPYLACAPGAVAEAKKLVRSLGPAIDEAVIARSIDALITRWESPESAAGIAAFLAKEAPPWAR